MSVNYWVEVNRMYADVFSFDIINLQSTREFENALKTFYTSKNLTNFHVTICIDLMHFEKEANKFRYFTDMITKYYSEYKKTNPTKRKKVILHPWIQYYRPNQNPFIKFSKIFLQPGPRPRREFDYIFIQGESKFKRVQRIITGSTEMIVEHTFK